MTVNVQTVSCMRIHLYNEHTHVQDHDGMIQQLSIGREMGKTDR